jgi:hypothetical protein
LKISLLILFFLPIIGSGQDSSFALVRKTAGQFSSFAADNLGNLYLITTDNQLKKQNVKGDSMGVYNDVKRYGKLYAINAVNPLKTLLFFKDYRTIVVLDRLLNAVNIIDLRSQNILQVRAIAPSYDNNIWVFDEQQSILKKIGEDGRVLSETSDLRIALGVAPIPMEIFDQNGFVYLYDPVNGMFVFDYYGSLKTKIALIDWQNIQVLGNIIVGTVGNKLMSYTMGTLELKETELPQHIQQAKHMEIMPLGIYILREDGISLYRY